MYLKHSWMISRWARAELQHMTHRSWLKLLDQKVLEIRNLGIRQIVVPENDKDPTTSFSERVTNRYTDVVKGDVSRSGSWRVASLDVARFDSRSALN